MTFNLDAPVLKDANGQHFQSWARCSRVRRLLAINPATLAVARALLGEGIVGTTRDSSGNVNEELGDLVAGSGRSRTRGIFAPSSPSKDARILAATLGLAPLANAALRPVGEPSRADAALGEAASRAGVAFEAAPSTTVARGFGLPTTMRCVHPRSLGGRVLAGRAIQSARARVWRSSASGILPIWTNRRSPSGALSPLRCRRELIPIPPDQGLCQASAQSSGTNSLIN
jgi:hypothetical protein